MNVSGEIVTICHLLIKRAFREKRICMDNDYIKEFLFLFISLSINLKLSIIILFYEQKLRHKLFP